ncbi:MAG: Rid family detoxifying hydrolase, partial [Balneolaceae bacterium]
MSKKVVKTESAPNAIGPYSQAIVHNGIVYCSGQIPLIPGSMELIDGDIGEQTDQVMRNLEAVLTKAGSSMGKVLKCTIYLADMSDFQIVNEIYGRYFQSDPPARETVAVRTLPKNV